MNDRLSLEDLSEDEKEHLLEQQISLFEFKEVAAFQKTLREKEDAFEPCRICKRIAQKLGFPV